VDLRVFFSFYCKNSDGSEVVTVWSGLDGTGSILATIPLPPASDWTPTGDLIFGSAMSVVFNSPGVEFDDITNLGQVVPEPPTLLLLATGVLGLGALHFRSTTAVRS